MKTEKVPPNVGNFIDSLREIGYSTEVAVADLIDNSVTANSSVIKIYAVIKPQIIFAILDNGKGMSEEALVEAMRLASMNRKDIRDKDDLGRFGLGLKTASFSQCRKLTVLSKNNGIISTRQWDLDFIASKNEWLLISPDENKNLPLYNEFEQLDKGTLVVWDEVDKIPPANFSEMIDKLRNHLSLVFHKFLEGTVLGKKLKIYINNNPLVAFNPFNLNHPATQQIGSEKINIYESSVLVQPFILPHHSKISKQEYDLYATEEGYSRSQGFYLYRQHRIIIYGTWWGLHKAIDAHKLIRIRIDIPNTMDDHWGIDVKKSIARPADGIKKDLRRIISQIVEKGARPYSSRGKRIEDRTTTHFWDIVPIQDYFRFSLNQKHPLYENLIGSLNDEQMDNLTFYLKGIQAYLPLDAIQAKLQSDPHILKQETALTEEEVIQLAAQLKKAGLSEEYLQELLKTEIFKYKPEILKQ